MTPTSGNGYVTCRLGHAHWGRYGAAGILLRHRDLYLVTHRSRLVHEGGVWGIPGGAIDHGESPQAAAVRELGEELGSTPLLRDPRLLRYEDHGGWSYSTFTADVERAFAPRLGWETSDARWLTIPDIGALPLHPGFRAAWETLSSGEAAGA